MENYNWIKCIDKNFNREVEVRQKESRSDVFVDREGYIYNITDLDFTVKSQENLFPAPEEFLENFKKNLEETKEANARQQENLMKMFESMDAKAIADHKAKIDEREFWRKLRGEVFKSILENGGEFTKDKQILWAVDVTENVVAALYKQDYEFFRGE